MHCMNCMVSYHIEFLRNFGQLAEKLSELILPICKLTSPHEVHTKQGRGRIHNNKRIMILIKTKWRNKIYFRMATSIIFAVATVRRSICISCVYARA